MHHQTPQVAPAFTRPDGAGIDQAGNVNAGPTGNLRAPTVGSGLAVKTGANSRLLLNHGPLVGGTLLVADTTVTVNTVVLVTGRSDGAAVGGLNENFAARVPGASFTVKSTNAADTQHFDVLLVEAIP